jgi:hypothetical protein
MSKCKCKWQCQRKRQLKSLSLIILLLLFISSGVWANEYFLYDLEKNKILVMGDQETAFTERMDLEKNPDMMMQTSIPNKYLAIHSPGYEQDKQGRIVRYFQPGQLIVIDLNTGRTEDLVELGYLPFIRAYTQDHRHFFIVYWSKPDGMPELLHYNIAEMKSEKLTAFAKQVKLIEVSQDQKQLYLVTGPEQSNPNHQLLTVNYSPLAVKNTLTIENNPVSLYGLGNDRIALVDMNPKGSNSATNGSIKLIDTKNNLIIEERKFKFLKSRIQWFSDQKVLILIADDNNKSRCYKINNDGVRYYEIPGNWIESYYFPKNDILYILTEENLKVIDYQNSATRVVNTDGPNNNPENYHLYYLPNSNFAIIYCFKNGVVKFLDITKHKIIKKVNCGRAGIKFLNALLFSWGDSNTVVTTNQSASKFFILNRATGDITVFNESFKRLGFIVPSEPPLAMYQIEQPALQTVVVTEKRIYKINDQDLTLAPVYQFKGKSEPAFFMDEAKRVILMTNLEIIVLDPVSLVVKNSFYLYISPNEKYTKLKPGELRYYFIHPL